MRRPAPERTRREGAWAGLVGPLTPGASAAVLACAGAGGVLVAGSTARRGGTWRAAVLGAVAFDLVGGLVAFHLPDTRERYAHSSRRSRLLFVAAHAQPFVLPLTGLGSWRRAAARYATALGATAALGAAGDRVGQHRAITGVLAAAATGLDLVTAPPGQRWFGPVYLLKLVGGHGGIAPSQSSTSEGSHRPGSADATASAQRASCSRAVGTRA